MCGNLAMGKSGRRGEKPPRPRRGAGLERGGFKNTGTIAGLGATETFERPGGHRRGGERDGEGNLSEWTSGGAKTLYGSYAMIRKGIVRSGMERRKKTGESGRFL